MPVVAPVTRRDLACEPLPPRPSLQRQKMAIGFHGDPVAPGSRSGSPTTRNSQRPSSATGACQLLQLQAVGDAHAHGGQLEGVDRVGHLVSTLLGTVSPSPSGRNAAIRRSCIQGTVSTCRPALPSPAGGVLVVPGAERQSARMMSGAEDEDVALAEAHALRHLDRLEFPAVDRVPGLEPVDAAMARRIEQHTATDDAGGIGRDAAPFGAARGECRGRLAVVELPPLADVVERVDVGVAVAVAGHAEEAHAEGQAALADRDVVHQRHEVVRRAVGCLVLPPCRSGSPSDTVRPLAHQARCGGDLVRGQVVERASFVVRPPASPVLDGLEHALELLERPDRVGCGRPTWSASFGCRRVAARPDRPAGRRRAAAAVPTAPVRSRRGLDRHCPW